MDSSVYIAYRLISSLYHFINYNVLWKESLNSDGQQFHQYLQNEQSPLFWTH